MTAQPSNIWHILGAGAMGCLWSSHLLAADYNVQLILSPRRKTPTSGKVKLTLQANDNSQSDFKVDAHQASEVAGPINNLIVSTRANNVLAALQSVETRLRSGARILLLMNGMGYHQSIAAHYQHCKLYAGATTEGAWLKEAFHVVHAGKGRTTIGSFGQDGNDEGLAHLLNDLYATSLQLESTEAIEAVLLEKVMINAAINGLTAIHECQNGQLLKIPAARMQLQELVDELRSVLQAMQAVDLEKAIEPKIKRVIQQTANNFSSTYQHIKHKQLTEIDFINGYVCELGTTLALQTPCNRHIVDEIKKLERPFADS